VVAPSESRAEVDLLTYVTHEIGNHLTVVNGFAEMLADGIGTLPPEMLSEFSQAIVRSGAQMRDLLQAVSDLQRIEKGQFDVRRQEVDLAALVRRVVDLWRLQLGSRRVVTAIPDELVTTADRDRIGAALAQLLSNVARFTPPTSTVEVVLAVVGDAVELAVTDDGPGVAPEQRAELFERRAPTARGAGAGLYVARHVARAHGGDLVLADAGTGARFLLRLPHRLSA
jgi:two-component system sensor histidine kinase MtrB